MSKTSQFEVDTKYRPDQSFGPECTGVYDPRLLRDGWVLAEAKIFGRWNEATVFEKSLTKGWRLQKVAHEQVGAPVGNGCYWDEHVLLHADTDTVIECPEWEWADWDNGALVWAEKGGIYRAKLENQITIGPQKLLHDFDPYRFQRIKAPY